MADLQNLDVYSIVTLVDRTGIGGTDAEFVYDGIRFPFVDEDGQAVTEKTVPQFVAEYLFTGTAADNHCVWTRPADGESMGTRVNRYGIKHCPKSSSSGGARRWPSARRSTKTPRSLRAPMRRCTARAPVRVVPVNIPRTSARVIARVAAPPS